MKRIVIALGGNALQEAGKPATAESQLEVVEKTSEYIADIIESGYDVVLAHGNGPQVGRIVLQNEYASAVTTAMPKYASRVAKKYMEKQPKTAVIQKRIQFRFFRDSCQAREMGTSTQRLEL